MSLNLVNKTTGDLEKVAGNATDKVGNLDAATTTDKSSVVAMVNELDAYTKRVYGSPVDISSYDDTTNYYTVPYDGVIVIAINDIVTNAKASVIDLDLNADLGDSIGNGSTQIRNGINVLKGQRIYILKTNAVSTTAHYFPKVNPS